MESANLYEPSSGGRELSTNLNVFCVLGLVQGRLLFLLMDYCSRAIYIFVTAVTVIFWLLFSITGQRSSLSHYPCRSSRGCISPRLSLARHEALCLHRLANERLLTTILSSESCVREALSYLMPP